MTAIGQDSLGTRQMLDVGGKQYAYYSLAKAAEQLASRLSDHACSTSRCA